MSYETKYPNWREMVEEASSKTLSAAQAAAYLGIKIDTYKKYAVKYNCYVTNQSGIGIEKKYNRPEKLDLWDILEGKHPQYQSNKLRIRLLNENVFEHICDSCGNAEWQGKPIPLELDHINGINSDHKLENLRLLCPNCHAQTDTYRGKNMGRKPE